MTESIGNCTRFNSTHNCCVFVLGERVLFTAVAATAVAASIVVAFVLNLLLFSLFSIFSATYVCTTILKHWVHIFSITQILTGFFSLFEKFAPHNTPQTHSGNQKKA